MKDIYKMNYIKLGLKISYYRKLCGMTQEELAEAIDKTTAHIGHIEAPNIPQPISLDTLFDISSVLSIPPYKLLDFDD